MQVGDRVKVAPKTRKGKNRVANGIGNEFVVEVVREHVAFTSGTNWALLAHPTEGARRQSFWVRLDNDENFNIEVIQ